MRRTWKAGEAFYGYLDIHQTYVFDTANERQTFPPGLLYVVQGETRGYKSAVLATNLVRLLYAKV